MGALLRLNLRKIIGIDPDCFALMDNDDVREFGP